MKTISACLAAEAPAAINDQPLTRRALQEVLRAEKRRWQKDPILAGILRQTPANPDSLIFGGTVALWCVESGLIRSTERDLARHTVGSALAALDHVYSFTFSVTLALAGCAVSLRHFQPLRAALPVDPASIAYLFGALLRAAHANRDGVVYTPQNIAQRIVLDSLADWRASVSRSARPLIFDPSCGAGIFLLEAVRALAQLQTAAAHEKEIFSRIYGVDRDALACATARLVLLLEAQRLGYDRRQLHQIARLLERRIVCGDTLLDDTLLEKLCGSAALSAKGGTFDLIVGNPPYGLARDAQITVRENAALKKRYARARDGKVNKYLLFMARGFELLSPGGVLSFIVPNAWLGIRAARPIREQWLKCGALHNITRFKEPIFEALGVETAIFRLRRDRPSADIALESYNNPADSKPTAVRAIPVAACLDDPQRRISLAWSAATTEFCSKLDGSHAALGDDDSPVQPLIALQVYATGKGSPPQRAGDVRDHVFHISHPEKSHDYRYLQGRDLQRYRVQWSGGYLRYGPWLAEHQPLERYQGPRILVREILGAWPYLLNGALVEDTYIYNRSILHLVPRPGTASTTLWALSAIINSSLAGLVIALRGNKSQRRLFPKIVNEDLKRFPLPPDFARRTGQMSVLATLARARHVAAGDTARCIKLDREINSTVRKLYGIDAALFAHAAADACAFLQIE